MALINCKECQKEIARGVKKCPGCGKDQRNWVMRHKILTGIGVLILLAVIGSADGNKPQQVSNTSVSNSPANSTEIKKEGISSDVKISVLDVKTQETIGENEYVKKKASGVFKVIKISLVNNQKDAITVDSTDFKLIDSKSREFSKSTEGETALTFSKYDTFFLKKVNPGITEEGYLIFDMPKDATGLMLKAKGGMTGGEILLKVE